MKKSFALILTLFLTVNYSHAQLANLFKGKKKSKNAKNIGVEVTEDEKGISGTYYVYHPTSQKDSWFKKISQVAIQYTPKDGKLRMYASKKEYVDYYTASYVHKYKLNNIGSYVFSNNYRAPSLITDEIGVFYSLDGSTNINTCELTAFNLDKESYVMSKNKEFIDNMTEEKFIEYSKKKRVENCNVMLTAKMGQKPMPKRGMRDAHVEAQTLKVVKERAAQQGWADEITGVYIASKDWSGLETWVSTNNDRVSANRINIVILMQVDGKCKWQRAVVAKDAAGAYQNADGHLETKVTLGISLIGIVPENNPTKCEKVTELLK